MGMNLLDMPIFGALKSRMQFHNARQVVLAENVANAETPNYVARDVERPDFAKMVQGGPMRGPQQVTMPVRTDGMHLAGLPSTSGLRPEDAQSFEITPEGNSVILEEEMMKIAQNQMDHQMAASIYSRGMAILRTAVGRSA
ncbi:MAG: flagellar basal-body rod protein FlgB [Pseudomonadota bacterium]